MMRRGERMVGPVMLGSLVMLAGCSFAARSAEMYRKDTRKPLSTQNEPLKQCYEAEREKDESLSGTVVASFKLESDTGKVTNPAIVEGPTTAPEPLQQCVLSSIDGLALEPGDAREGDATFTWVFDAK